MPVKDDLGKRMKENYEQRSRTWLTRRTPVAIRIDGKAFHTFTRGFEKPFDKVLMKSMQDTMKYLCENIQGCVFGYTQSDEITLILIDYQNLTSDAWFDYRVDKVCSIAASMATMAFNRAFEHNLMLEDLYGDPLSGEPPKDVYLSIREARVNAINKGAIFDARCFNIPKEEVCNLIYWRQLDATRNSIQMVGQANFSHAELQNKSCNMIQDMLMTQKNINWNDFPVDCKRGSACIKVIKEKKISVTEFGFEDSFKPGETKTVCYSEWIVDKEMPILKGGDREYVDKFIYIGEE